MPNLLTLVLEHTTTETTKLKLGLIFDIFKYEQRKIYIQQAHINVNISVMFQSEVSTQK